MGFSLCFPGEDIMGTGRKLEYEEQKISPGKVYAKKTFRPIRAAFNPASAGTGGHGRPAALRGMQDVRGCLR